MKTKIISLCALTFAVAILFSSNYACTKTASYSNNASCAASCHATTAPQFSALESGVTAAIFKN